MSDVVLTEQEFAARRDANAKATEEALRLAEEHRRRDAELGITDPVTGVLMEASKRIKDQLIEERFGDVDELRSREDSVDETNG